MAELPKICPGATCHIRRGLFAHDDTGADCDGDVDWISLLGGLPKFCSRSLVGIGSVSWHAMYWGRGVHAFGRKRESAKRGYAYHLGLQDEAVNVESDCGARQSGFMSQREESGQQTCDVVADFLNGFKFRYGEPENLEVVSQESCLAPVPTSGWPCGKT